MVRSNSFQHLDPSSTKTYQTTVLYSFELTDVCLLVKVRSGYVVETPKQLPWIRGQHIDTLKEFFIAITPVKWLG